MKVAALLVLIAVSILYVMPWPKQPFDCRVLIGGWHPDVPARVSNYCRTQVLR